MEDDLVKVSCRVCGCDLYVTEKRFNYNKSHCRKFICEDCKRDIRLAASAKAAQMVKDMTPEQYRAYCEQRRANTQKFWDEMDDEYREQHCAKLSAGQQRYFADLPEDKRREIAEKTTKSWANLSQDRYMERCQHIRDAWYRQSEEEQLTRLQKVWAGNKAWWESLTREEYDKWKATWSASFIKSSTDSDNKPNRNEMEFIRYLNDYHLEYILQYINTVEHPNFKELFPINPVTKSPFVAFTHRWDFMVHTTITDFLIDVDGSIHDYEKNDFTVTDERGRRFKLNEFILFNDSKRPYQTDGYPAYVIQCYDDNLTLDSRCIDLATNKSVTLRRLLMILSAHNSIKEIIKEA